jgi:hypothetical protein
MNGTYDEKVIFTYYFVIHKCKTYLVHLSENGSFSETYNSIWAGSKFNEQVFVHFVTSLNWISIHDKHIVPAMKAANEDEFTMVRKMVERFSKRVNMFLQCFKKEDSSSIKSEETFDKEVTPTIESYKNEESKRLRSIQNEKKDDDKRTFRKWLSKFHELRQERGVWSLSRQADLHWKLDRRENYLRMRRKLTINYDYDDHHEASAKRDKTSIPNKAKNLNTQKIKKINGDSEQWMDWRFNGSLASESDSLTSSDDQEWNLIVSDDERVETIDLSPEKKFSAECEMIVLLAAIKGRIELTSTHLFFYVDREHSSNIEQESIIVDSEILLDRKWSIFDIREIYLRNYMLRPIAL